MAKVVLGCKVDPNLKGMFVENAIKLGMTVSEYLELLISQEVSRLLPEVTESTKAKRSVNHGLHQLTKVNHQTDQLTVVNQSKPPLTNELEYIDFDEIEDKEALYPEEKEIIEAKEQLKVFIKKLEYATS